MHTSAAPRVSQPPVLPHVPPLRLVGGRARVLVVDDELAIRRAIDRTLRREHDVVACAGAMEALALLRAGARFDVVLSDLMMPGMSGMELYAELAREMPEQAASVVFLTGGAFSPGAADFLARVPNVRLEKPFQVDALKRIVAQRAAGAAAA